MPILENMTVSERHNYERMKKRGYTDEQIKKMLQDIRDIPKEKKEEIYRLIREKMTVTSQGEE